MRRAALSTALAAMLTTSLLPQPVAGQQPQWRPSRIPENSYAQPLANAAPTHQAARPQSPADANNRVHFEPQASAVAQTMPQQSSTGGEQLGSSVVLRWRTVSSTAASEQAVADAARMRQQAGQEFAQAGRPQNVSVQAYQPHATLTAEVRSSSGNPLRSQVRQAAYQQSGGSDGAAPGADQVAPLALPPNGSPMPALPNSNDWSAPQIGMPQDSSPASPNGQQPGRKVDPLQSPEPPPPPSVGGATPPQATQPAPAQPQSTQPQSGQPGFSDGRNGPSSILEDDRPSNPFPPRHDPNSPSDLNAGPELLPPPRRLGDQLQPRSDDSSSDSSELKRRSESTSSGYCNEMRARMRSTPITEVSLDISPKYAVGFRAKKDPEQQRLDFASSAIVREWTDYRGHALATGRLIDLRDDRVVIDVDGREQLIPVRDLSDVDVAYVGESWNIPERCGTGYDPLRGRNFVPSTVQWAASGLCHKPLYFEQVQLERYGHETGPVLQPLISTAHFFGNIAVLPYKMGIHPPNECQYALGYFRPGNCAPYMVQPIPWSLRGAAVQAAVVTGGAALIP